MNQSSPFPACARAVVSVEGCQGPLGMMQWRLMLEQCEIERMRLGGDPGDASHFLRPFITCSMTQAARIQASAKPSSRGLLAEERSPIVPQKWSPRHGHVNLMMNNQS